MVGFLAGFTTFVANAAMPVMTIYLVSQDLDKHRFIGTAAWFFFILNLSKCPAYCVMGMFTPSMLVLAALLAPVTMLGGPAGRLRVGPDSAAFFRHASSRPGWLGRSPSGSGLIARIFRHATIENAERKPIAPCNQQPRRLKYSIRRNTGPPTMPTV